MTAVIIAEKRSARKNMAKALGGESGNFDGTDYILVNALGHLYEFIDPQKMVSSDLVSKYSSWNIGELPWDETDFSWKREERKKINKQGEKVKDDGVSKVIAAIASTASAADEIVIASDIDPTGEGDLLVWEIIDELDLHHKKITRMEFVDEAEESLRTAFKKRRPVTSMQQEGAFRKADYRSKFDFLSMQWTRLATAVLQENARKGVLRNGRLKSAMVLLVGNQIDEYQSYQRKPVYMARFVDENDVIYSNPEQPVFENKNEVDLSGLSESTVTRDSVTTKHTAPPKLLDLSSLSALLVKEGFGTSQILSTYQKMYESQVVSYPRTSDTTVTTEQFKDLLPLVDKIAGVVGVDTGLLTRRDPRKTHVKDEGAHGANRPGKNVPASLDAVESTYGEVGRRIYEILAQNYLTMLAEDYEYEQHKGHVTDYPKFVGSVSVPVSPGWKAVFVADDDVAGTDSDDEDNNSAGLGNAAKPVVGEKVNKRPPYPTMGWLMTQLKREDVGTGATRTSTFGEVTNNKNGKALLKESSGKLSLTDLGELNFVMLPDTRIGSIDLTKEIYANMDAIEQGTLTVEQALEPVKQWVRDDIEIMRKNAQTNITSKVGAKLMAKEKASGTWNGEHVSFNREVLGHRFSDDEVQALLNGENVDVEGFSAKGNKVSATGKLGYSSFTNDKGEEVEFFGYQMQFKDSFNPETHARGLWVPQDREVKFKRVFRNAYTFNDDEVSKLLAGHTIEITVNGEKIKGNLADQSFIDNSGKIVKYVGFKVDDSATHIHGEWVHRPGEDTKFKRLWGKNDNWPGHEFTDQEIADLFAGKEISFPAISKKGKDYTAKGRLKENIFTKNGTNIKFVGFSLEFDDKKKGR